MNDLMRRERDNYVIIILLCQILEDKRKHLVNLDGQKIVKY